VLLYCYCVVCCVGLCDTLTPPVPVRVPVLQSEWRGEEQIPVQGEEMQSRLASALQLLATVTVSVSAKDYPTCGDCWCVPDNNGLGPCPEWEPETDFSSAVTDAYLSQVPNEILKLECNPYTEENCTTTPPQTMLDEEEAVCAFKYSSESCATYSMITYANRQEAQRDGAVLTHAGSCGVCSTTQDLALYLSEFVFLMILFIDL
jgi:hypothetical protein